MRRLLLFHSLTGLMAAALAFMTPILTPVAAVLDRVLTFGLNFLDRLTPMAAMAGPSAPMCPTRDVTFLTTGLHRLAQKRSCLGDPEDDDEGDDEIDNGLARSGDRLNC